MSEVKFFVAVMSVGTAMFGLEIAWIIAFVYGWIK
jgi:hypothetical protein